MAPMLVVGASETAITTYAADVVSWIRSVMNAVRASETAVLLFRCFRMLASAVSPHTKYAPAPNAAKMPATKYSRMPPPRLYVESEPAEEIPAARTSKQKRYPNCNQPLVGRYRDVGRRREPAVGQQRGARRDLSEELDCRRAGELPQAKGQHGVTRTEPVADVIGDKPETHDREKRADQQQQAGERGGTKFDLCDCENDAGHIELAENHQQRDSGYGYRNQHPWVVLHFSKVSSRRTWEGLWERKRIIILPPTRRDMLPTNPKWELVAIPQMEAQAKKLGPQPSAAGPAVLRVRHKFSS